MLRVYSSSSTSTLLLVVIAIVVMIITASTTTTISTISASSSTATLESIMIRRTESLDRIVNAIEDQQKERCDCLANFTNNNNNCVQPGCGNNFRSNVKFECVFNFGEDLSMCGGNRGLLRSKTESTALFAPGTALDSRSAQDSIESALCGRKFEEQAAKELMNESTGTDGWIGFASVTGTSKWFPAFPFNRTTEKCDPFDATLENWYQSASAGTKDIVFIFDTSGSMLEKSCDACPTRLELMQNAAVSMMQTLTPNDFFGIIRFSSTATVVVPASGSKLLRATPANIAIGIDAIRQFVAVGSTFFASSFQEVGTLFRASNDATSSSLCNRIVVHLSDGVNSDKSTIFPTIILEQSMLGTRKMKIFTVSMAQVQTGNNAADPYIVRRMACENNGIWSGVGDRDSPEKLVLALSGYYKALAYGFVSTAARWAPGGYDKFIVTSSGVRKKIVTVSRPIYDRSDASKPIFIGAAVVVVPYDELSSSGESDSSIESMMLTRSSTCESTGNPSECLMQQLRYESGYECPSLIKPFSQCQSEGDVYELNSCNSSNVSSPNQMLCEPLNSSTQISLNDRGAVDFAKAACCVTSTKTKTTSATKLATKSESDAETWTQSSAITLSGSVSLVPTPSWTDRRTKTDSFHDTHSGSKSVSLEESPSTSQVLTLSNSESVTNEQTLTSSKVPTPSRTTSRSKLSSLSQSSEDTLSPSISSSKSPQPSSSISVGDTLSESGSDVHHPSISQTFEDTGSDTVSTTLELSQSTSDRITPTHNNFEPPSPPPANGDSSLSQTATMSDSNYTKADQNPPFDDSFLAAPPDPAKIALIAGSIAGVLVLICIILALIWYCRRRRMGIRRVGGMEHMLPARKNVQFNLYDEDSKIFRTEFEDQMDDKMEERGLYSPSAMEVTNNDNDQQQDADIGGGDGGEVDTMNSATNFFAPSSSAAAVTTTAAAATKKKSETKPPPTKKPRSVSFASNVKDTPKPTADTLQDSFLGQPATSSATSAQNASNNKRPRAVSMMDTEDPDSFFGSPVPTTTTTTTSSSSSGKQEEVKNDSFNADDYFGAAATTAASTAAVPSSNKKDEKKKKPKEAKEINLDDTAKSMDLDEYFKDQSSPSDANDDDAQSKPTAQDEEVPTTKKQNKNQRPRDDSLAAYFKPKQPMTVAAVTTSSSPATKTKDEKKSSSSSSSRKDRLKELKDDFI